MNAFCVRCGHTASHIRADGSCMSCPCAKLVERWPLEELRVAIDEFEHPRRIDSTPPSSLDPDAGDDQGLP